MSVELFTYVLERPVDKLSDNLLLKLLNVGHLTEVIEQACDCLHACFVQLCLLSNSVQLKICQLVPLND